MVSVLSSVTECREYQIIQPSIGAGILYNKENEEPLWIPSKRKLIKRSISKYRVPIENCTSYKLHRNILYGSRND